MPHFTMTSTFVPTSTAGYHDLWRKLWEDHIVWTRMVIIGILDDLPGTDAYAARLLQNPNDMYVALLPYYGARQAKAFRDLVTYHLNQAVPILKAAKAGQDTSALVVQWRGNASSIATQMQGMNLTYWPFNLWNPMWQRHLTVTLDEAVAHLKGNYSDEIAAWEKVHSCAMEMADFTSNGVVRQFPDQFT